MQILDYSRCHAALRVSQRRTLDGVPYYHNTVTEELSWDKPDILKTNAERKTETGDFCWVRDQVEGWIPARLVKHLPDGAKDVQTLNVRRNAGQRFVCSLGP